MVLYSFIIGLKSIMCILLKERKMLLRIVYGIIYNILILCYLLEFVGSLCGNVGFFFEWCLCGCLCGVLWLFCVVLCIFCFVIFFYLRMNFVLLCLVVFVVFFFVFLMMGESDYNFKLVIIEVFRKIDFLM